MTVLHALAGQISETYEKGDHDPFDPKLPTSHLLLTREAVRRLCWLKMTYQCGSGHVEGCGYRYEVYCALGVEGPPALKDAGLSIPCAFIHKCPTGCGGTAAHAEWSRDTTLDPLVVAPDDAPWFHLPETMERGDSGGALEWPGAAIVKARQWYHEEGPGERLT